MMLWVVHCSGVKSVVDTVNITDIIRNMSRGLLTSVTQWYKIRKVSLNPEERNWKHTSLWNPLVVSKMSVISNLIGKDIKFDGLWYQLKVSVYITIS